MPSKDLNWYKRPELVLARLVSDAARGPEPTRNVRRALVLAVDQEGGMLENPAGSGTFASSWPGVKTKILRAQVGPANPRGSIKARVLTDGLDRLRTDDEVRVFWPMFPPDQLGMPVSPGEHVYVMFEGDGMSNGFWLSRVPGHEGAGSYTGNRSYVAPSAPGSAMDNFEENPGTYPKDEAHASLAPSVSAIDHFED